jgi:hypothetical protein
VKYFKSQPLRVNAEVRLSVTTLMKLKRDVVATINIMQSQVEELSFIFDLSVDMPLYQEGYHMDCQQSLNAQHNLNTPVR